MPFFTEGLLHPLVTPSHLLVLLSMSLLLGQQAKYGLAWLSYLFAFVLGLIANRVLTLDWQVEQTLLLIALVISLIALLKRNIPTLVLSSLTIISALLLGFDSTPIVLFGLATQKIIIWQAGAIITSSVFLIIMTLLADYSRTLLQGIPLQVAASWIATVALLILTLSFVA